MATPLVCACAHLLRPGPGCVRRRPRVRCRGRECWRSGCARRRCVPGGVERPVGRQAHRPWPGPAARRSTARPPPDRESAPMSFEHAHAAVANRERLAKRPAAPLRAGCQQRQQRRHLCADGRGRQTVADRPLANRLPACIVRRFVRWPVGLNFRPSSGRLQDTRPCRRPAWRPRTGRWRSTKPRPKSRDQVDLALHGVDGRGVIFAQFQLRRGPIGRTGAAHDQPGRRAGAQCGHKVRRRQRRWIDRGSAGGLALGSGRGGIVNSDQSMATGSLSTVCNCSSSGCAAGLRNCQLAVAEDAALFEPRHELRRGRRPNSCRIAAAS